jgi:DNA invertase Pin-like site-specific DNA recombinase
MTSKKRALALIRVSTNKQDIARQRTDIEKLKKWYDLDIIRTLELVGVSGTATLDDKQVGQVLREVEHSGVDGLAASAVDRLARPQHGKHYGIVDGFKDARKTLWTVDDGELKVWTSEGFERTMNALTRAGTEWRKIRQRSMDGKAEKRAEGRHVNGDQSLPYGLRFDKRTGWSYDEAELAKVAKAYELLFEDRHALSEICRRVGWGRGMQRTLANPTWRGVRAYPATADQEAFEVPLPLKPLLSPEKWALAQTLLAKRRTWSKETRDQRHLGTALLFCQCGRRFYNHCDPRRGQHDTYYCSSRHPRGKGCGAAYLWREIVDAAIVEIVEEHMTDAKFLAAVFRRLKEAPQPDTRAEREKELAKLAARRKKWIEQYDEDRITKQEFEQKMEAVARAAREIEGTLPVAPPPLPDYRAVIAGLVRDLARFRTWPFLEQRATLKRIVRRLPVVDSTFTEVTVSGAYLAEAAYTKPAQPLKWSC